MGLEIKDIDLAVAMPSGGIRLAKWLKEQGHTTHGTVVCLSVYNCLTVNTRGDVPAAVTYLRQAFQFVSEQGAVRFDDKVGLIDPHLCVLVEKVFHGPTVERRYDERTTPTATHRLLNVGELAPSLGGAVGFETALRQLDSGIFKGCFLKSVHVAVHFEGQRVAVHDRDAFQ